MTLRTPTVSTVGILGLQRLAGNRATVTLLRKTGAPAMSVGAPATQAGTSPSGTAGSPAEPLALQRAGPAPAPYSPPGGIMELGASTPSGRPLGQTHPRSAPPPQWGLTGGAVDGEYEATVRPATLGTPTIEASYPSPGVYDLPPNAAGTRRQAAVSSPVSELVRDGEQEHSDDFWWAYQLAYEPVVAAINQLAAQPAKRGANIRAVNRAWLDALCALLPPQLRFDREDPSPSGTWAQVYGRLLAPSYERDRQGWHSMRQSFATLAERQAHGVPEGIELLLVLPNPADINVHASEERTRAAFDALPPGG
jgi:hypothetical protein